jgi:putative tryptophan/tyrosine transport system substrate-binding protein
VPVFDAAARQLGVKVVPLPVLTEPDIEPALTEFAREPNGGLMTGDSFTRQHYKKIVDLANRYRVPSISSNGLASAGGLMDYGPGFDLARHFGQAATYVDRILKGAKPGDLPVQTPSNYRLVINLKTAKALGLTISETLLATADEVIHTPTH